jgi:hypothetical protein
MADTLVNNFFEELNWSSQELDQAWFLETYQDWWSLVPLQGLEWVLFGVLLLRVCCIGSEFSHLGTTMNQDILEIRISKVVTHCDKLAHRIQDLVDSLPGTKSSLYAQITYLNAVYHWIQGRIETAWYTLGNAIRIVQYIGVDLNSQIGQLGKESRSEVKAHHSMCLNLLIIDSTLCFFLDRPPTISEKLLIELQSAGLIYHTASRLESEPDPSDERLILAGLWQHWTALKENIEVSSKSESIPARVEQQYHRLKESFIDQLPNAFSMDHPDKQWDQQNGMLKFQRNWLHANILMVQCDILQGSLSLGHTEITEMGQDERSMAYRHVKLLARHILSLREVLCDIYSVSGSTKGAISVLRPFATRSAILTGLSFITIRSIHADNGRWRSSSGCGPEDILSLEACRSHINNAMALLMALQGAPAVENEVRSLQAILRRIEDLGISHIESNAVPNASCQREFYKESLMGDTLRSPDFLRAYAEQFDGVEAFNALQPMNEFQSVENNHLWGSDYHAMSFEMGLNEPVQGTTTALSLDPSMPLKIPMFDTSTNVATYASS